MAQQRDDYALRDLLIEVGRMVPIAVVEGWSQHEYFAAEEWAASVKLHRTNHRTTPSPEPEHVRRYA